MQYVKRTTQDSDVVKSECRDQVAVQATQAVAKRVSGGENRMLRATLAEEEEASLLGCCGDRNMTWAKRATMSREIGLW
jgi:hypothetical protein